jgi:signal peptidase I
MRQLIRQHRGFLVFLLLFGMFRTAVADWNPIPSGSMRPNLLEGDVVFVNRLAFDLKVPLTDIIVARLGEPRRGDIVTFSSPHDGTRTIKRIIGVPGDVVAMRGKALEINGAPLDYRLQARVAEADDAHAPLTALRLYEQGDLRRHTIQWLEGIEGRDDFGPLVVPPDRFLMLGDNRDNSADSRYFGLVPRHLLIGRAERILVSADIKGNWLPRFGRFGQRLE